MGRIKQNIEIRNKKYWALFDTGARNTYITQNLSAELPTSEFRVTNPISLGGKTHTIKKVCLLDCKIKGLNVNTNAFVLDEIGNDEDGKKIDVLIGALLMQQWGIIPIPEKEDIDMSHYPKEFVEF
ncbi:MAG: hypothetical protein A3H98_08450 [Bacteroidetes bacterium RIFCSPLOWO2_02_FULL_36_8]|nr:MAG: hypothetical protein A3H98_08450 [Bacteroidetes bacterium RIFCSPLOWO2_02_FULL_36_8]OFY71382.1 MAG: hypothetical protein A3G23_04310 [Bacteroidetes bacterium RIFCSPLOWO2_12_FULL_37_12]